MKNTVFAIRYIKRFVQNSFPKPCSPLVNGSSRVFTNGSAVTVIQSSAIASDANILTRSHVYEVGRSNLLAG
jgi:hypothetical protein